MWAVLDSLTGDDTRHVVPLFGPDHECGDGCWCHPERDPDDERVVVHNAVH